MAENLLAELHPDPTAEDPAACRLIITDLHNRATPLIRYDIGDRVVPALPCSCGRVLPCFSKVIGRAYDFVSAPDGTRYHGEFFLYALEEAREAGAPIRQAQFVQTAPDHITIRIVPGPHYTPEDGSAFAARLRDKSRERFHTSITPVSELTRERSGKIRLVHALPVEESVDSGGTPVPP
jgi:phenylacetate-CoA ligase